MNTQNNTNIDVDSNNNGVNNDINNNSTNNNYANNGNTNDSNKINSNKKDRRIERTKILLINSLSALMESKNIKDITVKELCEYADINRGTFYLHYKDIYDMLDSVEDEITMQFEQIFLKYDADKDERFPYPIFLDMFKLIDKKSDLIRALIGPNGDISFIMKIRQLFRHKCIESWIFSRVPRLIPHYDYFSNFIVYGSAGLIENWLTNGKKETPEEMAALITKLVSTGVSSLL